MKALVTGASGIIGANLVRELLAQRWEVRALVRKGPPRRALGGLEIELAHGDVLDPASLPAAMAGVDVVFHCAARFSYGGVEQREMERVAIDGTRHVIEAAAAAKVGRCVLTSSSVIFGSSGSSEPRTEDATFTADDASAYALSKFRQSATAFATAATTGIDLVAVCPTLTMGAWDYGLSESNAIIVKYLNDPFRTTFAGGCNIVAATDIARGHLLVASRGVAGRSYLLGGENLAWRELHAMISALCGAFGPLTTATHTTAYLTAVWSELMSRGTGTPAALTRDEVRMMGRWYWYDDSRARQLGYRSDGAQQALQTAIHWLMRTDHIRPDVRAWLRLPAAAPFTDSHSYSERT
jgi:dihydroflavonol-4-reductase